MWHCFDSTLRHFDLRNIHIVIAIHHHHYRHHHHHHHHHHHRSLSVTSTSLHKHEILGIRVARVGQLLCKEGRKPSISDTYFLDFSFSHHLWHFHFRDLSFSHHQAAVHPWEVWSHVWSNVWSHVWSNVWSHVWSNVWSHVWSNVWNNVLSLAKKLRWFYLKWSSIRQFEPDSMKWKNEHPVRFWKQIIKNSSTLLTWTISVATRRGTSEAAHVVVDHCKAIKEQCLHNEHLFTGEHIHLLTSMYLYVSICM